MAAYKLSHLEDSVTADAKVVLVHYKMSAGQAADMRIMRQVLTVISGNRSYDDNHPRWEKAERCLPHDGREYCFYYVNGANDDHVQTLLKRVSRRIVAEGLT